VNSVTAVVDGASAACGSPVTLRSALPRVGGYDTDPGSAAVRRPGEPTSCRGVESFPSSRCPLPGVAPRCRAVADVPHHHAVPLTTRWYGHLIAALLAQAPVVARTPLICAAPVPRYGTVRGELVPLCDFPLGLHRETAGYGMLAITFVHFPGRLRLGAPVPPGPTGAPEAAGAAGKINVRYVSMVGSRAASTYHLVTVGGRRVPMGGRRWWSTFGTCRSDSRKSVVVVGSGRR
jgi:hypothetical protein